MEYTFLQIRNFELKNVVLYWGLSPIHKQNQNAEKNIKEVLRNN